MRNVGWAAVVVRLLLLMKMGTAAGGREVNVERKGVGKKSKGRNSSQLSEALF